MSDCVPMEWDLPWHILVEILGRIPAVSLARCSCVATSWREVTKKESSLKKKIGLERAWLHEAVEPIIHEHQIGFCTLCSAKMEDLIALGGYPEFKVFDFHRKEFVFDPQEINVLRSLSFMDGMLLTGNSKGDLCGWDIFTWTKLFSVQIYDSIIWSIADLGDNVAVGGAYGNLQIWRKGVWGLKESLQGHTCSVYCILPQPNDILISGSRDMTIRIWDLVDNACLRVIGEQTRGVFSMDVCDGLIFCEAPNGNIRSWDFESGEHVHTFRGHTNSVTSIVVKEGRMFTGSYDGTIKMWDVTKGECVRTFLCRDDREQEEEPITGIWIDDEKLVAVRGYGEIWEWDFSKGW